MMRILSIVLFGFLFFIFLSCNDTKEVGGNISISKDPYVRSIDSINNLIKKDKENPDLYFSKASIQKKNLKYEDALSTVELALKIKPKNIPFLTFKADILYQLFEFDEAVLLHKQILGVDSTNNASHHTLARYYISAKDPEEAFYHINSSLKNNLHQAEPYYLKGIIYLMAKDTNTAISSFQTSIEQNPNYFEAHSQLALIYSELDSPLADQYFNSALYIKPKSIEILRIKSIYHKRKKEFEKALEGFNQIKQIDSTFEIAYFDAGVVYMDMWDADTTNTINDTLMYNAIHQFDTAIKINKNYTLALFNRAICYDFFNEKKKAVSDLERVIEIEPNNTSAQNALNNLLQYNSVYGKN